MVMFFLIHINCNQLLHWQNIKKIEHWYVSMSEGIVINYCKEVSCMPQNRVFIKDHCHCKTKRRTDLELETTVAYNRHEKRFFFINKFLSGPDHIIYHICDLDQILCGPGKIYVVRTRYEFILKKNLFRCRLWAMVGNIAPQMLIFLNLKRASTG